MKVSVQLTAVATITLPNIAVVPRQLLNDTTTAQVLWEAVRGNLNIGVSCTASTCITLASPKSNINPSSICADWNLSLSILREDRARLSCFKTVYRVA